MGWVLKKCRSAKPRMDSEVGSEDWLEVVEQVSAVKWDKVGSGRTLG